MNPLDIGTPAPLKARMRPGRSVLMWHRLKAESEQTGRPIVCARCQREHQLPPKFGGCACGSYRFEVSAAVAAADKGRMAGTG